MYVFVYVIFILHIKNVCYIYITYNFILHIKLMYMWDIFGEQILEAKIKQNVYKKGTEI